MGASERTAALQKRLDSLLGVTSNGLSSELEAMRTENQKLKLRLDHLCRAVAEEEASVTQHSPNVMGAVQEAFNVAISAAFPHLPAQVAVVCPTKHADYQCNNAMSLAKLHNAATKESLNPRQIGEMIMKQMPSCGLFSKVEVAGPGFVNVHLDKSYVSGIVQQFVLLGALPPSIEKKRRVVIDYSSPNVAKEMHVGHLRSTVIGDSIARLCRFLGHDVLAINHIGDWGTQFGMLIAHLRDVFPKYLEESPNISDLMSFYKESKQRFDSDEDFKKRAYQSVVKLQSFDKDYTTAWQMICDVSRLEFQKVYDRLGVRDLVERGESFYQSRMGAVVSELTSRGLLQEEDGRTLMFAEGCSIPLTIVKSDGGFTYDTSDMAAIKQRLTEENGTWLIYVVDNGQALHFESFLACARRAGWYDDKVTRVEHVGFGVVLGEDRRKFKTRSGDTVRLVDLLDEGLKKAGDTLVAKGKDKDLSPEDFEAARSAVAYGCIKYADLSHCRTNDYVFSFDKMLDDKGNTAVYLLYAFMRIRAITRVAGASQDQLLEKVRTVPIELNHPKELKLAMCIIKFGAVVTKVSQDLLLHSLCDFLYEIATTFTEFYDVCYCVEKDATGAVVKVNWDRLLLCSATVRVMEAAFHILGLETLNRM